MSHLKERLEKNCLNCNAQVLGKYCHVCGQENLEPAESAWHLITHFFQDITHFDGKFFSTLKYLVSRPGFLSNEYKNGRRASYLNPVRMYLFTSAIFFLIFFSFSHLGENVKSSSGKQAPGKKDSAVTAATVYGLRFKVDSVEKKHRSEGDTSNYDGLIQLSDREYKDKMTYDSVLKTGKIKDGWLKRLFVYKQIELREKYKGNSQGQLTAFVNNLIHTFPQMLFISLPLFALILKLLYVRRKSYYYANHAIFSIHLYVFVFIMLLFVLGIKELNNHLHWTLLTLLNVGGFIYIFYYQYRSMRKFYLQGGGKTFLKFFLLNSLMIVVIACLVLIFMIFSLMKL